MLTLSRYARANLMEMIVTATIVALVGFLILGVITGIMQGNLEADYNQDLPPVVQLESEAAVLADMTASLRATKKGVKWGDGSLTTMVTVNIGSGPINTAYRMPEPPLLFRLLWDDISVLQLTVGFSREERIRLGLVAFQREFPGRRIISIVSPATLRFRGIDNRIPYLEHGALDIYFE